MLKAVDLDGNPRVFYGHTSRIVDMGAYEYGSWPFGVVNLERAAGAGVELTWKSRSGHSYTIWSCTEICGGPWNEEGTMQSAGEATSWTDGDPSGVSKFYRIEIK